MMPKRVAVFVLAIVAALICGSARAQVAPAEFKISVVGGLAGVSQYTNYEQPFWTNRIPELTNGRLSAEIQPSDQSGIRGQEMLRLLQLGVIQYGTVLLPLASVNDPILAAPDLTGLEPDLDTLRRAIAGFRPFLTEMLADTYGIEVLALYVYPAQVLFCRDAFQSLRDLKGRRIRTANFTQDIFVEALGAVPFQVPFAQIVEVMKARTADCAITGTMSGNSIGLHELTSYISPAALSWGVSVFAANKSAWRTIPPDLQDIVRANLQKLEREIWDAAQRDTDEGIVCNTGQASCVNGKRGKMIEVPFSEADRGLLRQIVEGRIVPSWIANCGDTCIDLWNRTIGPIVNIPAQVK